MRIPVQRRSLDNGLGQGLLTAKVDPGAIGSNTTASTESVSDDIHGASSVSVEVIF
jgi:hypothetical protein